MSVFKDLNEAQIEAVRTVNGPLLILAGAGSGKTRVLTRRIAYLVGEFGVDPGCILAMTFTNKAAGEMRQRVEAMLSRSCRHMWIGTFHALCARILRTEAACVGLKNNFTIFDATDQLALMRRVIADQELSEKQFPVHQLRARISREKNRMLDPVAFAQRATTFYEQTVARVYRYYQDTLRQNNAVDFDDLLMLSVQLVRDHINVRTRYQSQFEYLLIDEYQDTNRPQYLFARYLAEKHQNICVVGDDDQSIYAWRGADLRNILDFELDYPNATVVKLEQNYRSTQIILDASNAVIRHNTGRKGKELWTENKSGEPIRLKKCPDEIEEARWIAGALQDLKGSGGYAYRQMAILYRTNAQSRSIEEGLRRAGIPYQIVGDVRFYERKEVKDVLAYLKLVVNRQDSISFSRILNTPRRGIGDASVQKLYDYAMREGLSPYEALLQLAHVVDIPDRTKRVMRGFYDMVEGFREALSVLPADELAAKIVDETGYLSDLEKLAEEEAQSRRSHVQELLADIEIFTEQSEDVSLDAYLQKVSLVTDMDQWRETTDAVTLMTLHSAKGLEFPVIFISGLEEGLFPILRNDGETNQDGAIEEERRLFYVGLTRAQERLFLSYAMQRRRYGGCISNTMSRFVGEIPEELLDSGFRISEIGSGPKEKRKPKWSSEAREEVSFGWEVGTWVYHAAWGRGQIQQSSGSGPNAKLKVRFDSGIIKTLIAKYANLQSG